MNEQSNASIPVGASALPLAQRADFVLGNSTVRPSRLLLDGPLCAAKGEPRVIQVLVALADARGRVLSRDELLQKCWSGRIVGDDAINRAIAAVRKIAMTVGAEFEVETIPRVGYRLSLADWPSVSEGNTPTLKLKKSRRAILVGSAGAVATLGIGSALLIARARTSKLDELVERGRLLQASGDSNGQREAAVLFREVIAHDPSRADAWGWLAAVADDDAMGRNAAQHALLLDPLEPNARVVLAVQRRDLDDWTQFENSLLQVLEHAPSCALALSNLTLFFQGMGRCHDSLIANEQAIRVEEFNPAHHARRAMKHWIFGNIGEADRVANQAMRLWPRNPNVWNARLITLVYTDRSLAAMALLENDELRPPNLQPESRVAWRAAIEAIGTGAPGDIARAKKVNLTAATSSPGLAANAIMTFSHLGLLDEAYQVADGLLNSTGSIVQRPGRTSSKDVYAGALWGRTQFLFVPACARFRADRRFPVLCARSGHVDYWKKRGIWPDPFVRGALASVYG